MTATPCVLVAVVASEDTADAWAQAARSAGFQQFEWVSYERYPGRLQGTAAAALLDSAAPPFREDADELLAAAGLARAMRVPVGCVLRADRDVRWEDAALLEEVCRHTVGFGERSLGSVLSRLRRLCDEGRGLRFSFVTVAPGSAQRLLAILDDGKAALLDRPFDANDDGAPIEHIELSDDGRLATIGLRGGQRMELRAHRVAALASDLVSNGGPIDGARLGARLRQLRLSAGLTQAEVARITGIHRPNIARVEAGRHVPSLTTVLRIAHAIGVSAQQVLAPDGD